MTDSACSTHDQIHQKPSKYGVMDQLYLGHRNLEAFIGTSPINHNTLSMERISDNSCLTAFKHVILKGFQKLVT